MKQSPEPSLAPSTPITSQIHNEHNCRQELACIPSWRSLNICVLALLCWNNAIKQAQAGLLMEEAEPPIREKEKEVYVCFLVSAG